MHLLVQPAPVFTRKVPVRLVPVLHAALPARARRGDGVRCICSGFEGLRVKGASPGVELHRLYSIERRRRRAVAVLACVEIKILRRVLGLHAIVVTSTGVVSRNDGRGWFLFRFRADADRVGALTMRVLVKGREGGGARRASVARGRGTPGVAPTLLVCLGTPIPCRRRPPSRRRPSPGTPSTRRLLDGVAVPVPHRSTDPARPRHRREMTS